WKGSEQQRHRQLWAAFRHVFEAHTCAHRLTYMFRVAGLRVRSPQLPKFAIECASSNVQAFEQQSIRPDLYLTTDPSEVTAQTPVVFATPEERTRKLRKLDIKYVLRAREDLGTLGRHDVEDLVRALQFGGWQAVGKRNVRWRKDEPYVPIATLNA